MVNRSHYRYPDGRLLVFAKAPVPGRVKTRLQPVLTPDECAELQQRLIEQTLQTATADRLCPVELWHSEPTVHPFFARCRRSYSLTLQPQTTGDLGQRMRQALEQSLQTAAFAVLIGCDCPALTPHHLDRACGALHSYDVTLVPAKDGGYVLIGARRITATIFAGVPWGSDRVLAHTRRNLQNSGLSWCEQSPLWDLDRPEDLARYSPGGPKNT